MPTGKIPPRHRLILERNRRSHTEDGRRGERAAIALNAGRRDEEGTAACRPSPVALYCQGGRRDAADVTRSRSERMGDRGCALASEGRTGCE